MNPLGAGPLLLLLIGLCSRSALAETSSSLQRPVVAPSVIEKRVVHSLGADYGVFSYQSTGLPLLAGGASLFYRARFSVGISLSAGLRLLHVDRLPSGFGFEGFVGVQLAPLMGVWRPLAGVEMGGTSLMSASLNPEPNYNSEEYTSKQNPLGPVYVGFVVSPLRFGIRRITFQALGLQLATHLPQWGNALRLQILAGQLEWSF